MTTFTDIRDSVIAHTNRPDLVVEMKVFIRKAVMKFHLFETFKRDLARTQLDMTLYPSDTFRWEFDLSTSLFPRYRKYYSLRVPPQLSPVYPGTVNFPLQSLPGYFGLPVTGVFDPVNPVDILDSYNLEKPNYFFQTGMILTVKGSFQPQALDFWYYQYPLVADLGGNLLNIDSWIASQFPDAIAEEAAAQIFKIIGKDEEFQRFQAFFAENAKMCQETDISAE